MNRCGVSAVLFARDQKKLAEFYVQVVDAAITLGEADYTALRCADFDLLVHQIPRNLLTGATAGEPLQRREQTALRLDFPVDDVAHARREAARLGGVIDERPPPWAGGDATFFLGHDSEGNVIGLKLRT
jgi:predicted enzyme related to lactoylglutathione lyase